MTIRLIFKGDISAADLDRTIFPDASGHAISVSNGSPIPDRHDIRVGKSGNQTFVEIGGVGKSEVSQATLDSIKSIVPTDHIRTEDV